MPCSQKQDPLVLPSSTEGWPSTTWSSSLDESGENMRTLRRDRGADSSAAVGCEASGERRSDMLIHSH